MADTTNTVVKDPVVLLHSFDWQVVDPKTSGKYVVVDLNKNATVATTLNKSTTQGENGRMLYFWLKDGNVPHQLNSDAQITLYVQDAAGKTKVGVGVLDPNNGQSGHVIVTLTQPFFNTPGQMRLLLAVTNNGETDISSPMVLNVADNMFTITTGDIEYSQAVDDAIQEMVKKVTDVTTTAAELQATFSNIQLQLAKGGFITSTVLNDEIAKLASLSGDNTFTGTNNFTGKLMFNGSQVINTAQILATPRTQDGCSLLNGAMNPDGGDGRPSYSMINVLGTKIVTIQLNMWLPSTYTLNTAFAQMPSNIVSGFWHMPIPGNVAFGVGCSIGLDNNGLLSVMGWDHQPSGDRYAVSGIATIQV